MGRVSGCKWAGSDRPRIVPQRHEDGCNEEACRGCQPCTEPHCRCCGITHADGACAECLATVRDNLREIGRLCDALPEEVEHRGINGEAMMLLGPATDPEAWGHRQASARAGRIPADYLDDATDENHPVFVTGTWDMTYRDAFEHDDSAVLTLAGAIDYLDRNLTYAATWVHVPFEDMARDLRRCVAHLEAVLHDGEQVDKGAPCMSCGVLLERVWGADDKGDGWRCPKCRESSSEDQYRLAVKHLHREEADYLTDRDMEIRTGVKAGTVREWARRGHVTKRTDAGRTLYAVKDVLERVA